MRIGLRCSIVTLGMATPSTAVASDLVTYSYDALGRLTTSVISGGPNAGVATTTQFDPAGNRSGYAVAVPATPQRAGPPAAQSNAPPVTRLTTDD